MGEIHELFGLALSLVWFAGATPDLNRERKISPKFFRPKFFRGRPRGMSVPKCLFFLGFGGPDRSFWRDVRRDVRPKTSSLG